MADGSKTPKERINISYKAKTDGISADVELPLKLVVMGNFTGDTGEIPLEEREIISVNKTNLNQVMKNMLISTNFNVKNTLNTEVEELNVRLNINNMKDFSPDNIVRQIPELNKLMKLREALNALKGPMGNIPDFRKAVLNALTNKETRKKLLLEIESGKDDTI